MASATTILSAYALPGRDADSRLAITHAIEAERIGMGSIWLSERWEGKEAGVLCGAIAQTTRQIRIVAGLIHFTGRHPLVTAGLGATMQRLSGNRFAMGVGRSSPERLRRQGFQVFDIAHMRDYARLLRRIWAGENVSYEGVLGTFHGLELLQVPQMAPPLILGATGPRTLALGGEIFDGVVLHPFLTTEGTRRSIEIVRSSSIDAGRDPAAVKITACVVTAPDFLTPAERSKTLEARAMTYFRSPLLGGAIAKMNGWNLAPLQAVADANILGLEPRGADAEQVIERWAEAAGALPPEWLSEGAAVGTVDDCADRLLEYKEAGADEILIHGTTPERLGPIAKAFAQRAAPG